MRLERTIRPVPISDVAALDATLFSSSVPVMRSLTSTIPCIESFFGTWELMCSRSDCVDDLLKALGVGVLKRRFLKSSAPQTEITPYHTEVGPCVLLRTYFKLGFAKDSCVVLGGGSFVIMDDDTSCEWVCHTGFDNGVLVQLRTSETLEARMADLRIVFKADPLGEISGPVCLFRWIAEIGGNSFFKNRWMRKVG